MNQKNYFFLICFTISNSQFAMKKDSSIFDFTNAYNQIKEAFAAGNLPLLVGALDFFSDFNNNNQLINTSIQEVMNGVPSPLLYSVKAIATLNERIENFVDMESVPTLPDISEIRAFQNFTRCQSLVKEKGEQFELLKLLCNSFSLFCSDQWNSQEMTPLIYACSCATSMEDEVRLLLVHNADPLHVLCADNVRYKTALEAAEGLKHESIAFLLKSYATKNEHSEETVTRSFFTTGLTKKKLEKKQKELVHAIEFFDVPTFTKIIQNDYIDVNDLYHDEKYGSIPLIAIALNQYFLQKELFHNIVPQNEETSQALKLWVHSGYQAAQTILFDIIEKKPNLNIDYIHPVTNEIIRGNDNSSTPLKEAIRRNARSVIAHLLQNNADLHYKGLTDDAVAPLQLASSVSADLLNYILKISDEEKIIPLETQNEDSSE